MHAITIRNDAASFAFAGENGDPWHHLGQDVRGYGTAEQMLDASHCDWLVEEGPLFMQLPNGDYQAVESHKATFRTLVDVTDEGVTTTAHPLGVVGKGWVPEHNHEATAFALDIVGATEGDAVIDTMGSLFDDREFFICIDLGTLVLDPDGMRDVMKRYCVVRNAHDASMSLTAFLTDTRVVCWNTATWAERAATQVVRIRHSSGKTERKAEAVRTLAVAEKHREAFVETVAKMVEAPGGHDELDRVIKGLWEKPERTDERRFANWADRRKELHRTYVSDKNAGGFGDTGWSVYNTIGEYLDHGRGRSDSDSRALASANPDSEVTKMKRKASELVLV